MQVKMLKFKYYETWDLSEMLSKLAIATCIHKGKIMPSKQAQISKEPN